jgi:hypothetical protein
MKLNELITESDVTELNAAPMGLMKKGLHSLGSKLGVSSSAAKLDVGNRANELFKNFKNWAIRSGVSLDAVPADKLNFWLTNVQKFPKNFIDQGAPGTVFDLTKSGPVYGNTGSDIFVSIANKSFEKGASSGQPLSSKYGLAGTKQTAQPGQPAKPGSIPNDVVKKLNSLSAADRDSIYDLIRRT